MTIDSQFELTVSSIETGVRNRTVQVTGSGFPPVGSTDVMLGENKRYWTLVHNYVTFHVGLIEIQGNQLYSLAMPSGVVLLDNLVMTDLVDTLLEMYPVYLTAVTTEGSVAEADIGLGSLLGNPRRFSTWEEEDYDYELGYRPSYWAQ